MDLVPDIEQFPVPREDDLLLFRAGSVEPVTVTTIDPLEGPAVARALSDDADAGKLEIIDQMNNTLQNVSFPEGGTGDVRKVRDGVYEYTFESPGSGVWACLYRFKVGKGDAATLIRKQHVIRVTSHRYIFLIPALRELLDKSRKRAHMLTRSGKDMRFGFTPATLSVYLDLGLGIINATPPVTSFCVENFPLDSSAVAMLTYAAFIVGLEAQGAYALDTDVNYQFSGNSLNVDHLTKIGQLLALPNLANYKERLSQWKQMFRPRGVALVQMQTSFSLGRLVAAIPGQFSRMGLGGFGPSSFQPLA